MKRRIAYSLMILALASTLVGGGTLALFTDEATADPVAFTAGTVEVTGQNLSITSVVSDQPDDPFQKTLTWCVGNTGSKSAYIRVRAHGGITQSETAVCPGTPYDEQPWWSMYFTYDPNYENSKTETLVAGSENIIVGEVTVNHDFTNLYVRYETINGWTLKETHVYAETEEPTEDNANSPGSFRSKHENLNNATTVLHTIPFEQIFNGPSSMIYLVTHAAVEKLPAQWALHPENSIAWTAGEGGWWYCPTPVPAGEKVCISLNVQYYDSDVEYHLEAEAVQASHNAIDVIWEGHPLQ